MNDNLAKNQPINSELNLLDAVHLAWLREDKASFSVLIPQALSKGLTKHYIIDFLEGKRNVHTEVDEDFENWAYDYIVSGGMGKLRPG
jgi:hypothetical protein